MKKQEVHMIGPHFLDTEIRAFIKSGYYIHSITPVTYFVPSAISGTSKQEINSFLVITEK